MDEEIGQGRAPFGTIRSAEWLHPYIDLAHWVTEFPLEESRPQVWSCCGPGDIAIVEQARELVLGKAPLDLSVPVDIFTWCMHTTDVKPWVTKIGGVPYRDQKRPWPTDSDGVPLHFLGQICLADSQDIIPFNTPGDVLLIFGRWCPNWVSPGKNQNFHIEWSSAGHETSSRHVGNDFGELPFAYQGVIFRTRQLLPNESHESAYQRYGWEEGCFQIANHCGTQIGAYADLPQGWPFTEGDGNELLCCLNSFHFKAKWPLCDVPSGLKKVRADGSRYNTNISGTDFVIGDLGCIWVYRQPDGSFAVDSAY
ncbi:MAG: DUF1963 domain-containing protein [Planctomycetota bacterium]